MAQFLAGLIGGAVIAVTAIVLAAIYVGQNGDDAWAVSIQAEQTCSGLVIDKGAKEIECRDPQAPRN